MQYTNNNYCYYTNKTTIFQTVQFATVSNGMVIICHDWDRLVTSRGNSYW